MGKMFGAIIVFQAYSIMPCVLGVKVFDENASSKMWWDVPYEVGGRFSYLAFACVVLGVELWLWKRSF